LYIPGDGARGGGGPQAEQGSGMDIVAILLALVVFALMFGLIRVMERI
jgi:hypothetical protein